MEPVYKPGSVLPDISANTALGLHLDALYAYDQRERMTAVNQWDGGAVPRVHLAWNETGFVYRFRDDLPTETCVELAALLNQAPLPSNSVEPSVVNDCKLVVERLNPVVRVSSGPIYYRTDSVTEAEQETTIINKVNAHLLKHEMGDWSVDVGHRLLFIATVANGQAVAVCASSRVTAAAHEAGVETSLNFRRRGYASTAVRRWTNEVLKLGAVALYSTSWSNTASQAVAQKLEYSYAGAELSLF